MFGPMKPPMKLPMELMRAMPAAAAVPRRKRLGRAQNGPRVPQIPTAAMEREATTSGVAWKRGQMPKPSAPDEGGEEDDLAALAGAVGVAADDDHADDGAGEGDGVEQGGFGIGEAGNVLDDGGVPVVDAVEAEHDAAVNSRQ